MFWNNHFETAVIKPTSTLEFQYFFGFKNLNEAKKEIKTKEFYVNAETIVKAEIINNNVDNNNVDNNNVDNNNKKKKNKNSKTLILEGGISKSAKRKHR